MDIDRKVEIAVNKVNIKLNFNLFFINIITSRGVNELKEIHLNSEDIQKDKKINILSKQREANIT